MSRNHPIVPSLAGAFALLALALAAPARAEIVTVKLKTDYLPYDDFVQVETYFGSRDGGMTFEETQHRTVFAGEDFASGTGIQVAEFDAPYGNYLLVVHLVGPDGLDAANQGVLVAFFAPLETTTLITKPSATAEKTVTLLTDGDGDGVVSAADRLRYTVGLQGRGTSDFVDEPDPGVRLIAGSVTTTHGVVTRGNGSGDSGVEISDIRLDASEVATVVFDAEVRPVARNQGRFLLGQRYSGGGGFRSLDLPTDDPGTGEVGDATLLEVECSFSSCEEGRARCEEDLSACEEDRAACERRLEDLLGDDDGDGVPAVLELCENSPPGEPVDERGCSREQFCALVDTSGPDGSAICRGADWMGDEPLGNPRDCHAVGGFCRAL